MDIKIKQSGLWVSNAKVSMSFEPKFIQMILNELDTIGMKAGAGLEHCHLIITNINISQEAKQIY